MADSQGEIIERISERFEQKPREVDQSARELEPEFRVYRNSAWNLQNPGTYVKEDKAALVVGNRPGIFHFAVALVAMCVMSVPIWLVGKTAPWIALPFGVLMIAPFLALMNTRRFEVAAGVLRARGRALGLAIHQDWVLPPDSAVRVESYVEPIEGMRWTRHQAQILVSEGWMGVAELLHDEKPVRDLARKIAAIAGVPLLEQPTAKPA